MTTFERGDVVLVEVPFTNQRQDKRRPAVVLSTDDYHATRDEIVVAAITSNLDWARHGDTVLVHWKEAGLVKPSLVTAIVQTLEADLVKRTLGQLHPADQAEVQRNLAAALGFSP
jgi:mRNA interferase MazF